MTDAPRSPATGRREGHGAAAGSTTDPTPRQVMRTPDFVLFAGVTILVCAYLYDVAPDLPDSLATHFDAAGRPNGWSTRTSFVWLYGGMLALLGFVFGALALGAGRVPASLWSFPHRDWWLSGERSVPTRRYLAQWLLRFGSALMLFLGVTLQQIVQANRDMPARLNAGWGLALVLLLVFTLVSTIGLFRRFARGKPDRQR